MEYHKKKWQLQAKDKQNRKKRRIDFGDVPMGVATSTRTGLGGFLRRTARSIMDLPWQIVQVGYSELARWYTHVISIARFGFVLE